jgi:hypothetical protein
MLRSATLIDSRSPVGSHDLQDTFNNHISGTLPSEMVNVTGLQILHVKKNRLSGSIPDTYGDLSHLYWIGK